MNIDSRESNFFSNDSLESGPHYTTKQRKICKLNAVYFPVTATHLAFVEIQAYKTLFVPQLFCNFVATLEILEI